MRISLKVFVVHLHIMGSLFTDLSLTKMCLQLPNQYYLHLADHLARCDPLSHNLYTLSPEMLAVPSSLLSSALRLEVRSSRRHVQC